MVLLLEAYISKTFQNLSRYPPHIWYEASLEHWLFMYATMPRGLFTGWGQRSLSRMILMLKYLVKVYFDSFEVPALSLGWDFP